MDVADEARPVAFRAAGLSCRRGERTDRPGGEIILLERLAYSRWLMRRTNSRRRRRRCPRDAPIATIGRPRGTPVAQQTPGRKGVGPAPEDM
jgi:hypothetical protein